MLRSELIKNLLDIKIDGVEDPEIKVQTSGCCKHGHDIFKAEQGSAEDETKDIIIRAG